MQAEPIPLVIVAPLPTPPALALVAGYLLKACGVVHHDTAARRQLFDLPSDGVVPLDALGELRFTATAPDKVELLVPRSFGGWIGLDGELVYQPGQRAVLMRFRRPLPLRLTLLGTDVHLAVLRDGQPVGVPTAPVRPRAADQVSPPQAPAGDADCGARHSGEKAGKVRRLYPRGNGR